MIDQRILATLFILMIAYNGLSQSHTIKGTVINTDDAPIGFATVLLLKAQDSTTVKGISSQDDGTFEFLEVPKDTYLLKASYVGSSTISEPFELNKDLSSKLLKITQTTENLQDVVITSQQPTLKREVDRLVFNVKNTALADSDIWDVLKQTPGILIINDQLTVKGSNNVSVLINDRVVNLPKSDVINLLSGTSASNIEAVEVYTNPPARFSAEGGTLINIKMDKNLVAGYNGAIYNYYDQAVFAKHTVGMDHYFRGKKTGFSVNYSYRNKKFSSIFDEDITFRDNGDVTSIWDTNQNSVRDAQSHTTSLFFDYAPNKKHNFDASVIVIYNPEIDRFYNTNTFISNPDGSPSSNFNTQIRSESPLLNASFYLDHSYKLGDKSSLTSSASHTNYDTERSQDLNTDFFDTEGNITAENDFNTLSEQDTKLYTIQSDFKTTLNDDATFETGLKLALINSESSIIQQGFDQPQGDFEFTENGTFDYDEAIYASYLSYNNTFEKLTLTAGLRGEYTQTEGISSLSEESVERDYFELFPSVNLLYKLNKKHQFTTYYFRRIARPRYQKINPFQYFQSNNSVVEGNPNLSPSFMNYVAAGYTYNNAYTFEAFYRNEKDKLGSQVFQDNDNNILRDISSNIEREIAYGLDIIVNKRITKQWRSYLTISVFQKESRFEDINSGDILENNVFSGFTQFSNSISFLKDRSLRLTTAFLYSLPFTFGNSRNDGYSTLDLSLRKTFWDSKGILTLGLDDILQTGNRFSERRFADQDNSLYTNGETRVFTIGFRYRFGNNRIRTNKTSKSTDESDRLR